jgi:anti-sigma B factor antagonist
MSEDYALITLVGEIDLTRCTELRRAVEAYRQSRSTHAVVDMSAVSFCGSEGAHFLASLLQAAERKVGTVTLLNASDPVRRLMAICNLDDDLIHRDRREPATTRSLADQGQ